MNRSLFQLISSRRSVRRFTDRPVPREILAQAVDAARTAPSAANRQFLEYVVVTDPDTRARIFPHLRWAAYVAPRRTPAQENRPTAYFCMLSCERKTPSPDLRDIGAAAENVMLTLAAAGVGTCWIASIQRQELEQILSLPPGYRLDSIIAAGYPDEDPVREEHAAEIRYWIDESDRLHVPKRPLETILHWEKFRAKTDERI
ncbi:MAG: nitroreductase [Candidatus Omnitrophica bacterium]|nr:nitroreductase [Candidatus Omnitrophota bacterium]